MPLSFQVLPARREKAARKQAAADREEGHHRAANRRRSRVLGTGSSGSRRTSGGWGWHRLRDGGGPGRRLGPLCRVVTAAAGNQRRATCRLCQAGRACRRWVLGLTGPAQDAFLLLPPLRFYLIWRKQVLIFANERVEKVLGWAGTWRGACPWPLGTQREQEAAPRLCGRRSDPLSGREPSQR